jgi:hypothetical protein
MDERPDEMSRKPNLSYNNLAIVEDQEPAREPAASPTPASPPDTESELLRDVSHQTMMYLHVDGVRALDEYALAKSTLHQKIKRHDLIVEAIEEWAARHGIKARFRAKVRKRKARRRYVIVESD